MVEIRKNGPIWTLDIGETENRFSPGWLDEIDAALDELDSASEPVALVTTARGKFFSNGLDLDWLEKNTEQRDAYIGRMQTLLARVLTLPVPTIAAINGHAFGGGAMLALAHDFRIMREGRGFLCFPEVDIKIPFTDGMNALITSKVSPSTALAAMTTGRRYTAEEALVAGLVDASGVEQELPELATSMVSGLAGKDPATLRAIKTRLFADVVAALRGTVASD